MLGLKTKVFCRKNNQIHFPMDKGQSVPKYPKCPKIYQLNLSVQTQKFGISIRKKLYWVFVVRGPCYSNLEPVSKLLSRLSS